jgi:predicted metal-binding protein
LRSAASPLSARRQGATKEWDVAENCLHVCVTCGYPDEPRSGQILHDRIAGLLKGDEPFVLKPITCLARCDDGCSVAATAPGKWGYLLGRLSPDHAADLITYATAYAATASGAVLPSRRPASLKNVIIGRTPALEAAA